MTRRVAFLAAVFSVAALLPVTAVSASTDAVEDVRYELSHFPVQTIGPPGFEAPNDGVPWGLDRIDQRTEISASVQERSYSYDEISTGVGVTVYVADTGVQADHVDFFRDPDSSTVGDEFSLVESGWSYRNDAEALSEYVAQYGNCGNTYSLYGDVYERQIVDAWKFDKRLSPWLLDDDGTTDNGFHGTHVASTIVGELTGVAKGARVVPLRVLDSCGRGNDLTLLKGLEWVLSRHTPGDKTIVNLSLGFNDRVTSVDQVITQMINAGIIVVAAAGNIRLDNTNNPINRDSCTISPAGSDPRVITVAASDWYDSEADFSFGGSCVDIFAPGYFTLGAWSYKRPQNQGVEVDAFLELPGTSMAAPHVAGVLARYLQTQTVADLVKGATVSDNAMTWLKTNATCNAVTYVRNFTQQTPNRLLAIGADVTPPCAPTGSVAVAGTESATISWTEPAAFNGEAPTYTATASPGGQSCTTTGLTCTITGLVGGIQHTVSLVATNSAGSSSAVSATVTPQVVPAMSDLQLTPGNASITAQWTSSTTTATTYTAVASPGGQQCVTTSTSCIITELTNNQFYTVTVTGANYVGSTSLSGNATPNGAPQVPVAIKTTTRIGRATFQWTEITDSVNPTYTLSSRDGRHACVSTGASCEVRNLPNGKLRTLYLKTSTPAGGTSVGETAVKVWAGFKVRRTEVKKSSRILLTSIVVPVSTGRRTYSTSSACRIASGRLITPRRATTCYVTLRVAKTRTTAAMSVRLKVAVR